MPQLGDIRPTPQKGIFRQYTLYNHLTLLLDSGVLADQQLNESRKQCFASLADVVNKLEEAQVKREFLL
jgi:hypothetical protein